MTESSITEDGEGRKTVTEENKEQTPDRQNLIETAVKFLKNPKVAKTAEYAKREFLRKKGLTESEINSAIEAANAYIKANPNQSTTTEAQVIPSHPTTVSQQQHEQQSLISIAFKWIRNFLLPGCLAFTVYKLIIKVKKNMCIDSNFCLW